MLLGEVLFFRACENRTLPNRKQGVFVVFEHKPTPTPLVALDFGVNAGQYVQVGICT
jgi:hypothetical protein